MNRRRRKEIKVRLAIIFALMIILLSMMLFIRPSAEKEDAVYITYTVRSGETLREICREFYGYEVDVRKKIDAVAEENGIRNVNEVTAGRVLWLEVE